MLTLEGTIINSPGAGGGPVPLCARRGIMQENNNNNKTLAKHLAQTQRQKQQWKRGRRSASGRHAANIHHSDAAERNFTLITFREQAKVASALTQAGRQPWQRPLDVLWWAECIFNEAAR